MAKSALDYEQEYPILICWLLKLAVLSINIESTLEFFIYIKKSSDLTVYYVESSVYACYPKESNAAETCGLSYKSLRMHAPPHARWPILRGKIESQLSPPHAGCLHKHGGTRQKAKAHDSTSSGTEPLKSPSLV